MELHESENSFDESFNPFITSAISEDFQDYLQIFDINYYDPFTLDKNVNDDIALCFKMTSNGNDIKANIKSPIFKTDQDGKKRGQKRTINSKNHEHSCADFDNIISKIQTHFLNFLICFLNDAISILMNNKRIKFVNFSHAIKSKATKKHMDKIKNYTIMDILKQFKISPKYKKYKKDNNKMNVNKLNEHPWFKQIFQMKYLDLFLFYYNHKLPLTKLEFFEKIIVFSSKTKSFYNLLEKNKDLKEDMVKYAKLIYYID